MTAAAVILLAFAKGLLPFAAAYVGYHAVRSVYRAWRLSR